MTDEDEWDGYFRHRQDAEAWVFEVGVVDWPAPHRPELRWVPFRRWRRPPDAARLARARAAALAAPRFFRRCATCGTLNNIGHLHGPDLCQGCATKHHGVFY